MSFPGPGATHISFYKQKFVFNFFTQSSMMTYSPITSAMVKVALLPSIQTVRTFGVWGYISLIALSKRRYKLSLETQLYLTRAGHAISLELRTLPGRTSGPFMAFSVRIDANPLLSELMNLLVLFMLVQWTANQLQEYTENQHHNTT